MTNSDANRSILALLKDRHRDDVFDTEVTAGSTGRRMDFLAIACSWARPSVIAYEIKAERRDFVQDDKWPSYLAHCKQLVFVTAPGVATLGEIPEQCGWQELSKNGKRLLTRKKAPAHHLDPVDEARLYKTILMRRYGRGYLDPVDQWNAWLAQKRANRALGRLLRYEIACTVAEQLRAASREAKRLEQRHERLEATREVLKRMGFDPDQIENGRTWNFEAQIRRRLEAKEAGPVMQAIDSLEKNFEAFTTAASKLRERVAQELTQEGAA